LSYEERLENRSLDLASAARGASGHGGIEAETSFNLILGEMVARHIGQWFALPFSGQAIKNFEVAHRYLAEAPDIFPL
jgi:hypothetical protein